MNYKARIAQLEDTLKERDARIREQNEERDAGRALVAEISEQIKNMNAAFDRWIEAFDMEINERGEHHWCESLMQKYDELACEHRRLQRNWNKFVPQFGAVAAPLPLAASPSQSDNVLKRREAGHSRGSAADEIRTITDKAGGVDRATSPRLERVFPDRLAAAQERANKRLRDQPPRHITEL